MSPVRYFDDVHAGTPLAPVTKRITLVQMMMYGAATWDFMRLHYDADYARQRGFPQPCVDGQMLGAFLAQCAVEWAGDPAALKRLSVRYRSFVFPGDTVVCTGQVQRKFTEGDTAFVECQLVAENQHGEVVAGPATALVALPRRAA